MLTKILRTLAVFILFVFALDITTGHTEYSSVAQWQGPEELLVVDLVQRAKFKMTITVYNAVREQTDSTPNIMASGAKIDISRAHEYGYCAVSRDYLSRWGGILNYGDTIWISGTPDLNGAWIVQDTMNSRYTKRVDLLVHRNRKLGYYRGTMEVSLWMNSRKTTGYGDSVVGVASGSAHMAMTERSGAVQLDRP